MHLKRLIEKGCPESWGAIKDNGAGKIYLNLLVSLILSKYIGYLSDNFTNKFIKAHDGCPQVLSLAIWKISLS